MQVHGSKPRSMNQRGVTTVELVSPLHLFSIPVRPEHCVLKQSNGKRMANFSSVSKHVITMRAIVVTKANVVQPCIDPVKSPSQIRKEKTKQIMRLLIMHDKHQKAQTKVASRFTLEDPRPCTIFCLHLFIIYYVTKTFLLVSTSVKSKQLLCFLHSQGQKRKHKHATNNFVGFRTIPIYYAL